MKWLGKKQPCWCKSGKSYGTCHGNFDSILREYKKRGFMVPKRKIIKNQQQLDGIRESGKRNIAILDKVAEKYQNLSPSEKRWFTIAFFAINEMINEKYDINTLK